MSSRLRELGSAATPPRPEPGAWRAVLWTVLLGFAAGVVVGFVLGLPELLQVHNARGQQIAVGSLSGMAGVVGAFYAAVRVGAEGEAVRTVTSPLAVVERRAPVEETDRLTGLSLANVDLSRAALAGARLAHADLRCARLDGADLVEADLRGASLEGANLSAAALSDAVLEGARLQNAALRGASLARAKLKGVEAGGADFTGADLTGAEFDPDDLAGAILTGATIAGEPIAPRQSAATKPTSGAPRRGAKWY